MDCKQYKESLADAALGALEGRREAELRAHLTECRACRVVLAEQTLLFEAIYRGLDASISGEPSPDFAARVRMGLAEERPPRRLWLPVWASVAAGALAVLLLAAVWLARREPVVPRGFESAPGAANQRQAPIAEGGPSEKAALRPLPTRPVEQASARRGVAPPRKAVRWAARTDELEVLVPWGERAAVLRLYAAVWTGRADPASLLAQPAPLEPGALKIPPLEVAKFEVESKPSNLARER